MYANGKIIQFINGNIAITITGATAAQSFGTLIY